MEGKFPVEWFNGSDFGFWRMQMEAYLYGKDLYEPLAEKSEKTGDEEWKVLDRKAMSAIILSLSQNVAYHVKGAKSTKEVLQTLADMYEKPSAMNKVMLMKKLFRLQMEERKSVADHFNDFNQLTTQLASVDIVFDDEVKALILLSSLPDSWDVVVTSVSTSSVKEKMKFDNIRNIMLNEETRRKQTGGSSGSALHTESRGRPDTRGKYRGRSRSRGKNKGKKEMVCWNCEKPGHMKSECRAPKKEKEGRTANVATEEITDALLLSVSSSSDDWVVDSGASFHSCSNKDIMEPYTSGDFGLVYLADNKPLKIVGKGDVRIKSTNGSCWTLHDVRHIPGLKRNLISVGQLGSDGFHTTFGDAKWKISRGAMTLARGLKSGTLYMAGGSSSNIPFAGTVSQANLWHNRLGHMSENGMNVLKSKGRLPELKSVEVGHYEHCVFRKKKRVSFLTTGRTPRKEKLELVHTDLWGPAPVSSLSGSTYYMTFVDDSTRKIWVHFLKRKSDAFDTFRRWRALVENETGLQVKCLRSDNGGEYSSEGIKNYCADHGIRMQKTISGTPQQNGVAKRMNRTLNERARCMRLKSGLPKMFWADAVNTAAFLINRGPSVPLNNRIPEEVWSGKKVDLSFLRTFGCSAYILNDDRTKLDAKSIKCTFIGYGTDEFGYRFWDDQNRKIIRSRNVIFNEDVMYNDRKVSLDDDKKEREFVDLDISNSGIMRPADTDSVGVQTDEIEHTEIEPKPVSEEPITESSTPLALGREPRLRRAPDRYSPSLYYLFLSDCGEPECYAEAVMKITRDKGIGKLWLSQSDYIEKVLCRFKMENAKPVGTPLGNQFKLSNSNSPQTDSERAKMRVTPYVSAIGSLVYAMICTRPDIAHAVGVVSRFMSNPGVMHWEAVKWILRYLRGTKDRALVFGKGKLTLFGFVDADFAGSDCDKRRSTTGYVFTYGGTAVSWVSKLQKVVTLSTTEAEYVAVTEAAKELIWLQHFLGELGKPQADVILHSDSQSAIHLAKNPAFHSGTKHIEIKYHFIRQLMEKKALQLEKIQGEKNPADMLTKAVAMEKLKLRTASTGLDD
ncbi:UNVERIFIED_CONTAM: Retrovirus-related Pol polyprotein from transposon TNT 1-94 [Sesamum indicum]